MKRKKNRRYGRIAAAAAVIAVIAALPIDWNAAGQTIAFTAAAMTQPQAAAGLLADRLDTTPDGDEVGPPLEGVVSGADGGSSSGDTPSTPASTSPTPQQSVPPADGSGGAVITETLDTGDKLAAVAVKNRSSGTVDINAALARELAPFTDTDEPQVLVVHTHTTEGYMLYDAGYYNAADRARTADNSRNVCAAGQALVRTLQAAGIHAIQDTTVHDSPQYTGAYSRSAAVVQSYLKKYPSIRVVIDLHRDAVVRGDAIVKPTATVDGKQAAQMMFVIGATDSAALANPHAAENLALAAQWHRALAARSGDLMRPLNTVDSRYNQHLHAGYVLVEVGAEGNTVAEAVYSAELLGKTLVEIL